MIGVLQFPGSNCDLDVLKALQKAVRAEARLVFFKETDISDLEGLVVPGGFSYGDHLRVGAIAARMPVLDQVKRLAEDGKPVLGICNGFQILCESDLLPGALSNNESMKFICKWVNLKVGNDTSIFNTKYKKGEVIRMPIAHGEGRFLCDDSTLKSLEANQQIAFQYCDESGNTTPDVNPNGALENIAGVCNEGGNVLGLMPHPERASFARLGGEDGKKMFECMLSFIKSH